MHNYVNFQRGEYTCEEPNLRDSVLLLLQRRPKNDLAHWGALRGVLCSLWEVWFGAVVWRGPLLMTLSVKPIQEPTSRRVWHPLLHVVRLGRTQLLDWYPEFLRGRGLACVTL